MANDQQPQYPAGHPPHDPLNGMRVGGLIGGVVGAVVMLIFTTINPLPILIGGVIGAVAGYMTEKRKLHS
jgi:uncharacterized membrane protein YeaQ/YmgE (transglycosylase-associated protein family)